MAFAKTPEQHLADAMSWKLNGLKVIGPAKQFKDGAQWFVLCECLSCGKQQWLPKTKLRHLTHCGCQKHSLRKKTKPEPVKLTKEQKDTIDMELKRDKFEEEPVVETKRLIDILEMKIQNESVNVPRRLVLAMAGTIQSNWEAEPFWKLPPALFKALIKDTTEIYEALNGVKNES